MTDVKPLEGIDSTCDTENGNTTGTISLQNFMNKQKEFMLTKKLEGLSERTIKDYRSHFQYLNKWIEQEYCEISV
jgi:hypothetical protein